MAKISLEVHGAEWGAKFLRKRKTSRHNFKARIQRLHG